jgi:hypothetical protein
VLNVKVGDEVRVFDVNGRRNGQPGSGWPGKVVKVGRKYFTVAYGSSGRTTNFLLETGRVNDAYGHRSVKTLDQVAHDQRRAQAEADLTACGVELRFGHKLTLEQIEALAEVARTFTSQDEEG